MTGVRSVRTSIPENILGDRVPLLLGLLAAVSGAVFVLAHWSLALLGAIATMVLAAAENETFLLGIVFLTPMGWIAEMRLPLASDAGRVDVITTARLLVVVGFLAGRLLRDRRTIVATLKLPLTKLSFLFAAVTFASLIFGGYGSTFGSLKAIVRLLSYIGFYLVVVLWVNSRPLWRKVALTLMISTIFVAAFGIFQEIVGDYTSLWLFLNPPTEFFEDMTYRPPSFLANCNSLAGYLNLVLPFSLACWVLGEGRWKKVGAWTTASGVVALLLTQSLGGIGAFGGVIVLAILFFARTWKRKLALLTAICVLAAGFYAGRAVVNPSHAWGGDAFAYDQSMRLVLWGIAWNFFTNSPLLGVGWGNFTELYGSYVQGISWVPAGQFAAHNLYLQLLAETGLVGFGAFFLLLFRAGQEALGHLRGSAQALDKALGFGILGAILTMLMHGFVDFLFHASPQFGTLFWLLLALLVVRSSKGFGESVVTG